MRHIRAGFLVAGVATLLAGPVATAQLFSDEEEKSWAEQEVPIPAFPRTASMIGLHASTETSNQFFIDADSVAVGADGVVRYTVVVRSQTGVENVSFEGIRCATAEVRRYAFGRKDGTWSPSRTAQWTEIRSKVINNHHRVLHGEFLCAGRTASRSRDDILRRLRNPPQRASEG